MRVPWHSIAPAAWLWQMSYRPDREDWTYHAVLPLLAYALLPISAFAARWHDEEALIAVGAATLLQLFIGIHNSWDAVSYHVLVRMRNAKD